MGMGKHRFSGESLVGEGHPLWGLSGSRKPPAILSSVPHRSPPPPPDLVTVPTGSREARPSEVRPVLWLSDSL